MKQLMEMGVSGIFTNRPDVLKKALAEQTPKRKALNP
jgi:glycerophosphoryl diester phosphodiesterase